MRVRKLGVRSEFWSRLSPPWGERMVLMAVIALAFALRLYRLDYQSIWWDEGANIEMALADISTIGLNPKIPISATAFYPAFYPPFYFYLLHFWLKVAGQTEFAARFLSTAFSLLAVVLLFRLGKHVFQSRVSVLATALASFSPLFVHEAQEVRIYALLLVFSTLSIYLLWQAVHDGESIHWVGYVLCTLLSLYTHYMTLFLLIVQAAFFLLLLAATPQRFRLFAKWASSQVAISLLFLPQLSVAIRQANEVVSPILIPPPLPPFLLATWQMLNVELTIGLQAVIPLLVGMVTIVAVGLLQLAATGLSGGWRSLLPLLLVLLWLVVPPTFYWVLGQGRPFFHPRHLSIIAPAYLLLLACGLTSLWRRVRPVGFLSLAFVILVFGLGLRSYFFDPTYFRDDTRGVAAFLQELASERDIVLADIPVALKHYYRGPAPLHFVAGEPEGAPDLLTCLTQGHARVFLVRSALSTYDPVGIIPFLLEKHGRFLGQKEFRGYWVSWYQLPSTPSFTLEAKMSSAGVALGDFMTLIRYAFGGQEDEHSGASVKPKTASGGSFWVITTWRLKRGVAEDYGVGIRLVDAQGRVVGGGATTLLSSAWDSPGLASGLPTSKWKVGATATNYHIVPVEPGTPPGEYQLQVDLFDLRSLDWVRGFSAGGRGVGRWVSLGAVQVVRPERPPTIAELEIEHPHYTTFSELVLLGFELPRLIYASGDRLSVALYWEAQNRIETDYLIEIRLEDAYGEVWARTQGSPVYGSYPTTEWEEGERLRDWYELRISPDARPGDGRLIISVWDAETQEVVGEKILTSLEIVRGRDRLFTAPPIEHPVEFYLGDKIRLLGYDLNPMRLRPGEAIAVTLYWKALGEIGTSYTVFNHLLDLQGHVQGQSDGIPGSGHIPTTEWYPGEIIVDRYYVVLDPEAPPGEYALEVGMYDWMTLERLPVYDRSGGSLGDRILLGPIRVEPLGLSAYRITHPTAFNLGDKVRLLGYDLAPTIVYPGGTLHLALYWQTIKEMEENYTVFTHLIDGSSHIWGQMDHPPLGGAYPTSSWQVGEVIRDEYEISVDLLTPSGEYRLEVGMYLLTTGERLPLLDEGGQAVDSRILLPTTARVP